MNTDAGNARSDATSRRSAALQRAIEEAQERHRRNENRQTQRREAEVLEAVVAAAEAITQHAAGGGR